MVAVKYGTGILALAAIALSAGLTIHALARIEAYNREWWRRALTPPFGEGYGSTLQERTIKNQQDSRTAMPDRSMTPPEGPASPVEPHRAGEAPVLIRMLYTVLQGFWQGLWPHRGPSEPLLGVYLPEREPESTLVPVPPEEGEPIGDPAYEVRVRSSKFPERIWFYHEGHCNGIYPVRHLRRGLPHRNYRDPDPAESLSATNHQDCQLQVTDLATGSVRLISVSRKNTRL